MYQIAGEVAEQGIKIAAKRAATAAGTKVVAKQGAQVAGKVVASSSSSFLNWIPFVGAGVNIYCGVREILNGNIKNGLIDFAQAGIGLIPGAGTITMVSVAIGAEVAKRVIKIKDDDEEEEEKEKNNRKK